MNKGRYLFEVLFNESTRPNSKTMAFDFECLAISLNAAVTQAYAEADRRWSKVPGYQPGRVCVTEMEEASPEDMEDDQ